MKINYVRGLASLTRVTVGCIALMLGNGTFAAGPGWLDNYEQAVQLAKQQGRPLFVDFSTSWCGVCKQMDRTVFADPNIISRLDNYVKVKVDAEVRTDLSNSFAITGYPTFVYLDPKGRVLDRKEGGIRVQEMADALDRGWQSVASQAAVAQANSARNDVKQVANEPASRTARPQVASTDLNLLKAAEERTAARPASESIRGTQRNTASTPNPTIDRNDPNLGDSVYAMGAGPSTSRRSRFASDAPANGLRELAESAAQPQPAISEGDDKPAESSGNNESAAGMTISKSANEPETPKADKNSDKAKKEAEITKADTPEKVQEPATMAVSETKPVVEKEQLTLKAPVEMVKTDVSPVVESRLKGLADDELPKPLLSRTAGNATQAMAAAPKVSTGAPSGDPLATIRRIQGDPVIASPPLVVASATPAEPTIMKPAAEKPLVAPKVEAAAPKIEEAPKVEDAPKAEAALKAEKTSKPEAKPETAKAKEADSDKAETSKKVSSSSFSKQDDIDRWMKDADTKLLDSRKKEARAMYSKVVENDPKNESGKSDMAYVKMVSLIVDRDSDLLRREAYNKIKEFEARYPGSDHKDYYTLIRAILAADLGETNEAHRLLGSYPERFPNSKYRGAAHKTWKDLPPVKKESSGSKKSTSAAASKKSGKSSDS